MLAAMSAVLCACGGGSSPVSGNDAAVLNDAASEPIPSDAAPLDASDAGPPPQAEAWAFGEASTIAHFDGTAWSTTVYAPTTKFLGAWVGPASIWAVGTGWTVVRYAGGTWTALPKPEGIDVTDGDDSGQLSDVWGSAENDVWVTETSVANGSRPFLHWDGSQWTRSTDALAGFHFVTAIHGAAQDDIWAAGFVGMSTALVLFHYDGNHWTEQTPPPYDGVASFRVPIYTFAPNDFWLGAKGNIYHWDGSTWTTSFGDMVNGHGSVVVCAALYGASSSDIWALIGAGTIHDDETKWALNSPTLTASTLHALGGVSTTDMWVVGDGGAAAHFDGTAWTTADITSTDAFDAVVGVPRGFGQ